MKMEVEDLAVRATSPSTNAIIACTPTPNGALSTTVERVAAAG
jgi:hypothetical protein